MSLPQFFMIDGAPQPVATFSHASEIDGWVFLTGQMPTWPDDPERGVAAGHRSADAAGHGQSDHCA